MYYWWIQPVFIEKKQKKRIFFTITPCKCSWKFYNWRRSWETRPKRRNESRERRKKRKPARLSGRLKESEMCLVTAQENFLEVKFTKNRTDYFKNQWRVWSWLRTNAGGVSYTCKSSEAAMPSGERVSNA